MRVHGGTRCDEARKANKIKSGQVAINPAHRRLTLAAPSGALGTSLKGRRVDSADNNCLAVARATPARCEVTASGRDKARGARSFVLSSMG